MKKYESWEEINRMLYYQGLSYILELIKTKLISSHHNNPSASHYGIEKTRELVARKYYREILRCNVKNSIKGCDICLASKAMRHKSYGDFQSLLVPIHWWKDLSMNFVTKLPISTNWKGNSYNSILIVIDRLTKMVHYEPVQTMIDAPRVAEVIIDVIVQHNGLPDSIVSNQSSVFTSNFWSSLCVLLLRHQAKTVHRLLPSNWRLD